MSLGKMFGEGDKCGVLDMIPADKEEEKKTAGEKNRPTWPFAKGSAPASSKNKNRMKKKSEKSRRKRRSGTPKKCWRS